MFCRLSFNLRAQNLGLKTAIRKKSSCLGPLVSYLVHAKRSKICDTKHNLVADGILNGHENIYGHRRPYSIKSSCLETNYFRSLCCFSHEFHQPALLQPGLYLIPCLKHQTRTLATSSSDSELKGSKPINNSKKEHPYMNSISRSSVVVKVKDLEEHLRIRGYSTLRWGLGILAAIGFGIYMFREPIKDNLSDEVADVASRSLGDQNVVLRANEVSKAIVNEILNDPNTLELAADFVTKLLQRDDVMNKTTEFVISVMNSPETRKHVKQLAKDTVENVLENESTRKLLLEYIQGILSEENTMESCKELLNAVAADPQSKQILADFFKSVLISDTVTDQAVALGKNVSHEVVMDKKLQEESVNALWNIFKMSLTPGWFVSSKEINKKHI